MKIELTDKTALVTGSTEGIGYAIARGLLDSGANVVVNGRGADKVAAAVDRLGGDRVRGVAADLATAEGCAALVEAAPDVDVLVHNAGIFEPTDFFEATDEQWDRHWQLNVMAGVRLSRVYAKKMVAKGWGRIVFLGSESSFNIPVEMIHYGVSKTADVALARGLAKRLAGTGVTVNAVLPGPTLSEGLRGMLQSQAEASGKSVEEASVDFVKANRPTSIIQRAATVEEVANMVVYVASPLASATTGAAVRVDGGIIDSLQ